MLVIVHFCNATLKFSIFFLMEKLIKF